MLANLLSQYGGMIQSIEILLLLLNAIVHVILAGGVAHDVGQLNRRGIPTRFVGGFAWVLATLLGGVLVLAVYWLVHHSTWAKS